MKKAFIILSFLLMGIYPVFSQVEFGKYSEKELNLDRVDFQPDAKIVTLWEEGNSYFMVTGLQTDFHFRYKVLSDGVENFGDFRIPFYRGKSLVENIVKISAQVSYLENGKRIVKALAKDEIKEINLGHGEFEYLLIFPHVKKGTIIEFTYKKIDHNYGILEGWSFQKEYPALFSKYSFKAPDFFQYQMIQQGKNVAESASIESRRNLYSWLRKDVPSLPEEPFVGNLRNYQERVDGYLYSSEYVNPDKLQESEMVYASWVQLANRYLEIGDVKSYFNPSTEVESILSLNIPDSISKLEQAKFIYDYVSKEIKLLRSSWLEPIYSLGQLQQVKQGNSFDKNLLFIHLLKQNGIDARLILISEKFRGRKNLIDVPFINQFQSCIVAADIDQKKYLLDASDSIVPFGLLPVEKLVNRGFVIEQEKGRLEDLVHQHRSGVIQSVDLLFNDSTGFSMKNQFRLIDHEAVLMGTLLRDLEEDIDILEKDERFNKSELELIKMDDNLAASRNITFTLESAIEESTGESVFIYPFQLSEFFNNPFYQDSRLLPVELLYPFFENLTATIPIPKGYELDDYPESTSITIPSKSVKFSYQVKNEQDVLKISSRLDITSDYFPIADYPDLKFIFESISSQLGSPVILKKIVKE